MVVFYGTKRLAMRLVPCKTEELDKMMRLEMARKKETSAIKAQIDENLKRVYQEALEEEVPDRFKELLDQLRKKESGQ